MATGKVLSSCSCVIAMFAAVGCGLASDVKAPCGGYRSAIKTGTDVEAPYLKLNRAAAKRLTVTDVRSGIEATTDLNNEYRRSTIENRLYVVSGQVIKTTTRNGEVTLSFSDGEETMSAVIPNSACIPSKSPFSSWIHDLHQFIGSSDLTGQRVRLYGMLFDNDPNEEANSNHVTMNPVIAIEREAP